MTEYTPSHAEQMAADRARRESEEASARHEVEKKVRDAHSRAQREAKEALRESREAALVEAAKVAEAEAKAAAKEAYPFSDAAFEKDWDSHLRAEYAATQMSVRQKRAQASFSSYARGHGGGIGGGWSSGGA